MLTISIDWLAVTFKEMTYAAQEFIDTYASFPTTQDAVPRNGYSSARVDKYGTILLWNLNDTSMGYHVVFSGTTLRNLFEQENIQPRTLLRALPNIDCNISRLDLAKDLTEQEINLSSIYQSLEQGHSRGTARKYGKIQSNDGGYTIYVGSRTSERFIRLYNKAVEQGDPINHWYRLELESKGMVARALSIALQNTENWAGVLDSVVRGVVWLPDNPDWLSLFTVGIVPIGLSKLSKETDREKWIASQVVAAVARHYIDNPNSEAIARLLATLNLIDRQRLL